MNGCSVEFITFGAIPQAAHNLSGRDELRTRTANRGWRDGWPLSLSISIGFSALRRDRGRTATWKENRAKETGSAGGLVLLHAREFLTNGLLTGA